MNKNSEKKLNFFSHNSYIRLLIILLSSSLLGVWAVKDTIALRNILLVSGTFLSIYFIVHEFKSGNLKEQCNFLRVLPIALLVLVFFWVLSHFIFFSVDPIRQFNELRSTWLRALMAVILGLGTGLALRDNSNRFNLLWLGIFISFTLLCYQYVSRALVQQKLLVPDYDFYLFHLKINTVLMGTILLAGIDGALFDHLRAIQYRWRYFRTDFFLIWLVGTVMVLWAFVFIVNARNGIGLSTILYSFWFICAISILIKQQCKELNRKGWFIFLFACSGLLLILYFGFLQSKQNPLWSSLIEDAKIAVQIDRYQNWQNPAHLGYPKRADGQVVAASNYERVAWAIAGSRAIFQNPLGVGVLSFPWALHPNPPTQMLTGADEPGIATHSGWVDLGLAFGIPVLLFIFSALLISFANALRGDFPAKMTVLGLVILIFFLYTVGEIAIAHGLEILFFLLAVIPGLLLTPVRLSAYKHI
jgi:hypothetical protein